MNNPPRKILIDLIKQHGPSICDDAVLLRNLLSDKCGEYRREIHLLMNALQERVPQDLLMPSSIPLEVLLSRLTVRLQDHLAVTAEAARWAIDSWGLALGMISYTELEALKVKQKADDTLFRKGVPDGIAEVHQTLVIPDGHAKVRFPSSWKWIIVAGIVAVLALSVVYFFHKKSPTNPILPPTSDLLNLFEKGNNFFKDGQYEKAAETYKQVIRLKPDDVEAHYSLGLAYSQLSRWQEALPAFQQVIRFKPDDALAHSNLGVAHDKLGSHREAVQAFQKAIKLKPDYALAHYNLGVAYCTLDRNQEAVQSFQQAIRLEPDYFPAYYYLGTAYGGLGRWQEAVKAFHEVIKLKPDYAPAYVGLGWAYLSMGNRDAALKEYKILKDLDPKLADMLLRALK